MKQEAIVKLEFTKEFHSFRNINYIKKKIKKILPSNINIKKLEIFIKRLSRIDKLSLLEMAEAGIIIDVLNRNNCNKNRSRKELRITINTLNAKIEKYGIVFAGEEAKFSEKIL